ITFPIRVMKYLGVKTLVISNAAGGMNPLYRKGDMMVMEDHINLLGDNPLIGPNDDQMGPRFPDMSEPYSKRLMGIAEECALEEKIKLQRGVYVAVSGPNLETRAEYRFLRGIGADVVGMSTIPEVIVARHMGIEVFGISVVTDECFPDALQPANVADIIKTANDAQPKLTLLMKKVIERL
ncbi:MAG: purine-nucleoside phosphorylase, partial [Calditrichia bacterium]